MSRFAFNFVKNYWTIVFRVMATVRSRLCGQCEKLGKGCCPRPVRKLSGFFHNLLGHGGFLAMSRLISLQIFIHAPNPKLTPLGPSINS